MQRLRRAVLGAPIGLLLGAPPREARADGCDALRAWEVYRGALHARRACGAFIATTDGSAALFSYGQIYFTRPVSLPFTASVTWQRLGPEPRPIELLVLGAFVLLKDGMCGLYVFTDDLRFERDGWRPLPGYATHEPHRIAVRQDAHRVTLAVDGRARETWSFDAPVATGKIGIAFKGASGFRSRIAFSDFHIDPQ